MAKRDGKDIGNFKDLGKKYEWVGGDPEDVYILETTLSNNVKMHIHHYTFVQSCAYTGPYLSVNDGHEEVMFQYKLPLPPLITCHKILLN